MKLTPKTFEISSWIVAFSLSVGVLSVRAEEDFDFQPAKQWKAMTDAEFAAAMKGPEKAQRKIASSGKDLSDRSLSKELREFRDKKIFALKTPDQIDALITEVNANYASYPNDLKLVAAGIALLKPAKGILYRARPFVERTRALHSAVLSSLRQSISFYQTFFPTAQWGAVMTYLAEPTAENVSRFRSEVDIQRYLANEVYPQLTLLAERISALPADEPIPFDYKILYGNASYPSDLDRYRTFGLPEKYSTLAEIHQQTGAVSFLLAYRWTDFLRVNSAIGFLYGIDGFKNLVDGVQGAPARDRVAVIKSFKSFLTLRDGKKGPDAMADAFNHFKESVRYSSLLWTSVKDRAPDYQAFIDPGSLSFKTREIPLGIESRQRLVSGPTPVTSVITNEKIKIDVPKFFSDPPKDLKDFLATDFQAGSRELSMTVGGKTMKYRNYLEGSPSAWNLPLYRKYVIEGIATNADVPKATRILGQEWGTDGIAKIFLNAVL
ncbi:MAG: hypothetical protein JST04_15195 [Bdellovibrionales bacterium]|nr:hypothetical protein [Bdellovibrionales bacterium]